MDGKSYFMKRDLTIAISINDEASADWLWKRTEWKEKGCELLCISWDNQVRLQDKFLDELDSLLEANDIDGIRELMHSFDWCPSIQFNKIPIGENAQESPCCTDPIPS